MAARSPVAFIANMPIMLFVSDVLEIHPDALDPDVLEAVERALETTGADLPQLVGPDGAEAEIPERIQALLVSIMKHLRAGNAISVVPLHAELTTMQAAEMLNVSRPYLIKQIEAGELAHHMVGSHRRLRLTDVLSYRERLQAQAAEALDTMTAEAEEFGLYR